MNLFLTMPTDRSVSLRLVLSCLLAVTAFLVVASAEDLAGRSDAGSASLVGDAERAYRDNRFGEAVRLYSLAIRQAQGDSSLFAARGMAYEMVNQPRKAEQDFQKALEIDPKNYAAAENLAALYEQQGKFAEAVPLYQRALRLDPRPARRENLEFSIAVLQSRLRPQTSSAVGCWHLANDRSRAGAVREAERLYSRAIELDSAFFQAYFSRGLLRVKSGDTDAALLDFDAAVRLCPTLRGCLTQRGLAYEQKGDLKKARTDFIQATRADPRDPEAHYHLGRILELQKEFAAAAESYREALSLNPKGDLRALILQKRSGESSRGRAGRGETPRGASGSSDLW